MQPANMLMDTGRQIMSFGMGAAAVGIGMGVAGMAPGLMRL